MTRLFRHRYGILFVFFAAFLFVTTATRLVLWVSWSSLFDHRPFKLAGVFLTGAVFDLAAAAYFALPLLLLTWLVPQRWLTWRWFRGLICGGVFLTLGVLLFGSIAEWFFWEEFHSRFNFIAVDYLVYTNEVIGNIDESYPMGLIFGGLGLAAGGVFYLLWRMTWLQTWFASAREDAWRRRAILGWLLLVLVLHFGLSNRQVPEFRNSFNQELARNGLYAFGAAFWENSLDYERFYPCLPLADAFRRVGGFLGGPPVTPPFTNAAAITRRIEGGGLESRYNVIQISVESLSAKYLGCFGNTNRLTPVLDGLYAESLVFTNLYATGTRTVRGMEALTLCLPPTPGQSVVRRPGNEDLFSVGALFRSRGYDTAFIYSGYGYFDNMNAFFSENGYRVVDRGTVAKSDITYATIWGACDEDLYRWTLREADASHAAGRPFHHFVMTTSNHRPFGFPAGRIDLPGGSRNAAVKYTDYALGQLLQAARTRPWFTNTLFVIVSDHCANAAGKTVLPIPGYHIPAFVWNPSLVPPRVVGRLCSQIDLLPTVFGLMHWSYDSQFFGRDILSMSPEHERAFISTYQRLGYLRDGKLAVLEPVKRKRLFTYESLGGPIRSAEGDSDFLSEAIAQYQTTSYLFDHGLYRKTAVP